MKSKKMQIITVFFAILAITLVYLYINTTDKEKHENCEASSLVQLCLEEGMYSAASTKGIHEAILYLDLIKLNPSYAPYCHNLAHSLGAFGYKRYNSITIALKKGGKSCSDGYFHGVIEEGSKYLSPDKFIENINIFCSEINDKILNLDCIHGIGHGAYVVADKNIKNGSTLCGSLIKSFDRLMCISGLFMQYSLDERINWQSDQITNITNICKDNFEKKPSEYKDACLMNIMLSISRSGFNLEDFSILRNQCDRFPDLQRTSCYYGIGYAGPGLVDFNPRQMVETTCGLEDNKYVLRCVKRESQAYGAVFGKDKMLRNLCPLFRDKLREGCINTEDYLLR